MEHMANKPTDMPDSAHHKSRKAADSDFQLDQPEQKSPMTEDASMTVGKVAKLAQVSTDTVRYYEKEGLITPAEKSNAGYRLYNETAVRRLNFIKHAQHCGLSLAEIRELLELKKRNDSCCSDVRTVALHKRLQLETKIKALQAMSGALNNLLETCTDEAKPLDECPILAALETSLKSNIQKSRNE